MAHEGQGLALRLEPGYDALGVEPGTDDLEGDTSPDGLFLLREIDDAHAAVAELADDAVEADSIREVSGRIRERQSLVRRRW